MNNDITSFPRYKYIRGLQVDNWVTPVPFADNGPVSEIIS